MAVLLLKRFACDGSMGSLLSLAGELNRQGWKPVVVLTDCPSGAAESCRSQYQNNGFHIFAEDKPDSILNLARRRQVNVVHVHSLSLLPLAAPLAARLNAPFGVTLYENSLNRSDGEPLRQASFIIKTRQPRRDEAALYPKSAVFIPLGVDLSGFKPGQKGDFTVTFITDKGHHGGDGCLALLKAAGLGNFFVNIAGSDYYPVVNGKNHDWQPHYASLLAASHVVVGRERAILEGMACGNAALVMGKGYRGILQPQNYSPAGRPDLSGEGTSEPCYRDLFNDLSELWKDRDYLETLQYWGRKFVRENHDLRLTGEATAQLYQKVLKQGEMDRVRNRRGNGSLVY